MMFDSWLVNTRILQRKSFGVDPWELEGEDRAIYLRWNALAAVAEIGESLNEVQWKPWAINQGEWVDRDAFVGEIVDVLHFLGNMLVAARVTDEDLSAFYLAKMRVNSDRQATPGGYDAIGSKCPKCGRALVDDKCPQHE